MTARVIQGFFLGGQPKLPPPVVARLPPPIQAKTAARPPGPPVTAFAGRPPGPPAPAFAARPPGPLTLSLAGRPGAMQRHGSSGAFAVEAGQVGLLSSGGRPLPDGVRGKMEAALGADFADVRVHVGAQAERIGAIAFTIGSDIYFAPGRYQPDTVQGRQLLGHELAHVVQQRAGRVRNPLGSGIAVVQDMALEAEADRLGRHAAAHRLAALPKMPPGAAQPSARVRISPPVSAGGRPVGMVHARDKGAVQRFPAPKKLSQAAIQRYFIGQASYTTMAGNLVGQDRQADNSFRQGGDTASIAWSGTDPTVLNSLKISEDGKIAIENVNGNRQAKVFFAKRSVVEKSNDALTKQGSKYLLQPMPSGHFIVVADLMGNQHRLDAIEPVLNPYAGIKRASWLVTGRLGGQQHGQELQVESTCIAVAEAIMNKKYNEGGAYMSANKLANLGLITPTQKGQWAAAIADATANPGNRTPLRANQTLDEDTIARAYGIFVNNNPVAAAHMAERLGVNEFANPKVGQSFISESIGIPAAGSIVNWLRDPTGLTNTSLMTPDPNVRGGERRTGWGNHMGAVVARSGGNTVTLENYARKGEEPHLVPDDKIFYFAMYGPRSQPNQTWHHVWSRDAANPTPIANAVTGVVG